MTLSELIKNLELQLKLRGDAPVEIEVRDNYTEYGSRAQILESPIGWNATTFTDASGRVLIQCNLKPNIEGKNPKITFRR